ncbi:hypothetical protein MXB_113, partial [Myxobolus squamalis]
CEKHRNTFRSARAFFLQKYNLLKKSIHDDIGAIKDSFLAIIDETYGLSESELFDENLSLDVRTTTMIQSTNSLVNIITELKELSTLLDHENYIKQYQEIEKNTKTTCLNAEIPINQLVKTLENETHSIDQILSQIDSWKI